MMPIETKGLVGDHAWSVGTSGVKRGVSTMNIKVNGASLDEWCADEANLCWLDNCNNNNNK